jgi:hypothetical protein
LRNLTKYLALYNASALLHLRMPITALLSLSVGFDGSELPNGWERFCQILVAVPSELGYWFRVVQLSYLCKKGMIRLYTDSLICLSSFTLEPSLN